MTPLAKRPKTCNVHSSQIILDNDIVLIGQTSISVLLNLVEVKEGHQ